MREPWITKDGCFDPAKFPIDSTLKKTLSADLLEFADACRMLMMMQGHDRTEAGIYLLGLLQYHQNDLARLTVVVEQLRVFKTPECAAALFSELRRVKGSNTTRGYLNAVIKTLSLFPETLVEESFGTLSEDKSFSPKMRAKFQAVVEAKRYPSSSYWPFSE